MERRRGGEEESDNETTLVRIEETFRGKLHGSKKVLGVHSFRSKTC